MAQRTFNADLPVVFQLEEFDQEAIMLLGKFSEVIQGKAPDGDLAEEVCALENWFGTFPIKNWMPAVLPLLKYLRGNLCKSQ